MTARQIESLFIFSSIVSLISGVITIYDNNRVSSLLLLVTSIIFIIYIFYRNYKTPMNFEILEEMIELKIVDRRGNLVKYSKQSKVRCTKSSAYFFYNTLSPFSGKIENIKISNGIIENMVKTNGTILVTSKLEKILKRNEIINREISCDFIDCFTNNKEYWVSSRNYPGSILKITIIFPDGRKPKTFSSCEKVGHIEMPMKQQPIKYINENNNFCLRLNVKKAKLFSNYILRWDW